MSHEINVKNKKRIKSELWFWVLPIPYSPFPIPLLNYYFVTFLAFVAALAEDAATRALNFSMRPAVSITFS